MRRGSLRRRRHELGPADDAGLVLLEVAARHRAARHAATVIRSSKVGSRSRGLMLAVFFRARGVASAGAASRWYRPVKTRRTGGHTTSGSRGRCVWGPRIALALGTRTSLVSESRHGGAGAGTMALSGAPGELTSLCWSPTPVGSRVCLNQPELSVLGRWERAARAHESWLHTS